MKKIPDEVQVFIDEYIKQYQSSKDRIVSLMSMKDLYAHLFFCSNCKGQGVIEQNIPADENGPEQDVEITCPTCNGSGDIIPNIPMEDELCNCGAKHYSCDCEALNECSDCGKPLK